MCILVCILIYDTPQNRSLLPLVTVRSLSGGAAVDLQLHTENEPSGTSDIQVSQEGSSPTQTQRRRFKTLL